MKRMIIEKKMPEFLDWNCLIYVGDTVVNMAAV